MTLLRSLIAFGLALSLMAGPAGAERIAEIDRQLEALPVLEGRILDEHRQVEALLADPNALLVARPGGQTVAMVPEHLARDIGLLHDWIAIFGISGSVTRILDESYVNAMRMAIATGTPRETIVAGVMTLIESSQMRLRGELAARRAEMARELEAVRARAEALRAERGGLIATRDAADRPGPTGHACLDPYAPNTGWVHWHAPMYGMSAYPMRGEFICNLRNGFTQMTAGQLRSFHCDISRTPPDCTLAGVTEFRTEHHPEYGLRHVLHEDNPRVAPNWFTVQPGP